MSKESIYAAAEAQLRGELLNTELPARFKDLLQRLLKLCEAGAVIPADYRDQYANYKAYMQRQDRYGH